ncbi:hypothetical protein GCM10018966_094180 [Streptomyces yanii]
MPHLAAHAPSLPRPWRRPFNYACSATRSTDGAAVSPVSEKRRSQDSKGGWPALTAPTELQSVVPVAATRPLTKGKAGTALKERRLQT